MSVAPRERLDAHRLIEDYMIAANVAAAKALEAKKAPVMYRVHEPPSREKLVALKDYLEDLRRQACAGAGDPPAHLQPYPRQDRRGRFPPAGHGAGAAHADPGLLRAGQSRPFRARAGQLRAFHLADPALCRPARPPLAGQRLQSRPRRADRGRGRGDGADRRGDQPARAPRDGGRARHDRPLCRRLSRRACRRIVRGADHRRDQFRLLRDGRRDRRRRADAGARPRRRIFPLRRDRQELVGEQSGDDMRSASG